MDKDNIIAKIGKEGREAGKHIITILSKPEEKIVK